MNKIQPADKQVLLEGKGRKKTYCSGCCSLRILIIFIMICLIISCSVSVWLASYIGSNQAINELSASLVSKVSDNVFSFITSELSPVHYMVQTMASDHILGNINFANPLPYIFQKSLIYQPSGCGFWYTNKMWGYTNTTTIINGELTNTTTLTLYVKPSGYMGVELWMCNQTDGTQKYLISNTTTSVNIPSRDYWTNSFNYFNSNPNADTYYGPPYLVLSSTYNIYASARIYDPNTKKVVGITKSNVSLYKIESFLKKIELIGKGYVLVLESNNMVIGGSINTTAADRISRIDAFSLTDKDSGALMKAINSTYGSLSNTDKYFSMSSLGVNYFISRTTYSYKNIRWNVFLVIFQDDIEKTTNINTAISIGVAVAVVILGFAASFIIGHLITQPLRYLESQFMKIKKFDLENVSFTNSSFKEIEVMYRDLQEMVMWLEEFKSFLPETIFNQLRNIKENAFDSTKEVSKKEKNETKENGTLANENNSSSNESHSNLSSAKQSSAIAKGGLFRLGLQQMKGSVVYLKLSGMSRRSTSEITSIFSKVVVGLSSLTKTMHCDLQIVNVDEFIISFTEKNSKKTCNMLALECSLKVSKCLDNIFSNPSESYCLGVSSGKADFGNLGTNQVRFYSIVGSLIGNAKQLTDLGSVTKTRIIADSKTLNKDTQPYFVYRPIERFEFKESNGSSIDTVFEIIKENSFEKDEWMYELEAQKENSKFKEFEEVFTIFENKESSRNELVGKITKSIDILSAYRNQNPNDSTTNRILKVLEFLLEETENGNQAAVSGYKSSSKSFVSSFAGDVEISRDFI